MKVSEHRQAGRRVGLLILILIAAVGAATICAAYWPGIMIDDARWQYQQALDNAYEDWHPPLMAWVWRQLTALEPGPAPMMVLQDALYWIGIALISTSAHKRGHPRLAVAAACAGFLPAVWALTGTVTKDAQMTGMLLVATGLLLWRPLVQSPSARIFLAAGALVLLFAAAALRFNAFFACVPLAPMALPSSFTRTKPRLVLSVLGAAGAFLMTAPAISALLNAEDTDVKLSLMIFDVGGITEHTGINQFPDLGVRNPVAANHRCYDAIGWDSYSDWAKTPCAVGFDAVQKLVDNDDFNPVRWWLHTIVSHPFAYLEHRWTYFNLSSSFLVAHGPDFTAWSQSVSNPWGFRIRDNAVVASVTRIADAAAKTPLGWPIFWIAVSLGALVAALMAGVPNEQTALAASAFLYGAGYLLVGVATGIRYYMWTFSGALIAALFVGAELWRRRSQLSRTTIATPILIAVVPTLMAIGARIIQM